MPVDRTLQSESMRSPTVPSIECIKGSSKADEWTADMLQTGDIVEEIRIGSGSALSHKPPFKGGKSGVQKILHTSYRNKETSVLVRVRRASDEFAQLQACIVPNETGGKKQYMLRSIADANYTVGFSDRTESECFELQGEFLLSDLVFLSAIECMHFVITSPLLALNLLEILLNNII